jgi:hypothetical protein
MELSQTAAIGIAQIIPILLLASYFDKDALNHIKHYSRGVRLYWISTVAFILIGEYLAINAIFENGVEGIRVVIIHAATVIALINLLSLASWRVLDYDLISGMPTKKK